VKVGAKVLTADPGSYGITGTPATLSYAPIVVPSQQTYYGHRREEPSFWEMLHRDRKEVVTPVEQPRETPPLDLAAELAIPPPVPVQQPIQPRVAAKGQRQAPQASVTDAEIMDLAMILAAIDEEESRNAHR
jgi:hypothetical protein